MKKSLYGLGLALACALASVGVQAVVVSDGSDLRVDAAAVVTESAAINTNISPSVHEFPLSLATGVAVPVSHPVLSITIYPTAPGLNDGQAATPSSEAYGPTTTAMTGMAMAMTSTAHRPARAAGTWTDSMRPHAGDPSLASSGAEKQTGDRPPSA